MAKFSLLTSLVLDAAGFSKGVNVAKKEAKALETGVKQASSNISGAFSSLGNIFTPMLGDINGLKSGIMGGVGAFKMMIPAINGIKAAFIATGIGAIIIAITTAIAGLISWMKRTDEGSDALRKVFDGIKAVINTVLDKLSHLGGAIVKLFKGDFAGAWEETKAAFSGWGEEIQNNIQKANELNEIQDELENKQEVYAKKRAKLEVEISELQNKARDEEQFSAKERLAANDKLKVKIKELYDLDFSLKNQEFLALKQESKLNQDNQEWRQKVNDKEAELIKLRAEYNGNLKETIKLNNKLVDQVKAQEDAAKLETEKKANQPIQIQSTANIALPSLAPDMSNLNQLVKTQAQAVKDLGNIWEQMGEKVKGALNPIGENINRINMAANMAGMALNTLTNIFEANKEREIAAAGNDAKKKEAIERKYRQKQKAMAVGQAIISGAQAVLTALGSFPPPLSFVMAALQAAAAASQIAVISAQKFAAGGIAGIVGGYSFSGDKIPALVNSGEMILNKGQQSNLFKMINSGFGAAQPEITTRVSGTDLILVLNNAKRRNNSYR